MSSAPIDFYMWGKNHLWKNVLFPSSKICPMYSTDYFTFNLECNKIILSIDYNLDGLERLLYTDDPKSNTIRKLVLW